jgi:hypothetical protein
MIAPDRLTRRDLLAMAMLIAGFTALRVALSHYSLWYDEYASLFFAHQPLARLWSGWMVRETNPPLFYTLLKGWVALTGRSIPTLRLLPEIGGAIQLALLAAIAWPMFGRRGAFAALLIAGCAAQMLFFGQLLRAYVFAADAMLFSLLGLLLWQASRERSYTALALYVAGAAMAAYCHTTLLLWPAIATLAYLLAHAGRLREGRWRIARQLLLADLAVAVAGGWWLAITLAQLRAPGRQIGWIAPLDLSQTIKQILATALLTIDGDAAADGHWPRLGIALAFLAGLVVLARHHHGRLVAIMALVAVILFWLAGRLHPIVTPQTAYVFTGFTVIALAGLCAGLRPRAGLVAMGAICAALLLNLGAHRHDLELEGWDGALEVVRTHPGSLLLVDGEAMAVVAKEACARRYGTPCPFPIVALASPDGDSGWAEGRAPSPPVPVETLGQHLAGARAVYTLRSSELDPLVELGVIPSSRRTAWNIPFLEGPFTPDFLTKAATAKRTLKRSPGVRAELAGATAAPRR